MSASSSYPYTSFSMKRPSSSGGAISLAWTPLVSSIRPFPAWLPPAVTTKDCKMKLEQCAREALVIGDT